MSDYNTKFSKTLMGFGDKLSFYKGGKQNNSSLSVASGRNQVMIKSSSQPHIQNTESSIDMNTLHLTYQMG